MWARTRVVNHSPEKMEFFLFTGGSDSVVLYKIQGDTVYEGRTGHYVPIRDRITWRGPVVGVPFSVLPHDDVDLYVLMKERRGVGPNFIPRLYDRYRWYYSYYSRVVSPNLTAALFTGALLIMFLYNLVVFFSTRIKTYLYYALYLVSILVALYFEMLVNQFGWIGFASYSVNQVMILLGINGSSMCYLLFGRSLVETKKLTPKWDRVLGIMVITRLLITLTGLLGLGDGSLMTSLISVATIWYGIEAIVLLLYFYWLIRLRLQVAWFFIVGSFLVFGGGFIPIFLANTFDFTLNTPLFLYGSILLEIVVFSLGLGYKMRKQQQDKLQAEQALNQELQKVNTAFGRLVPHEFIHSLGYESVLEVKLGDQVAREVTVLFSDLRGYTTLAEQMTPEENFRFLNAYLGRMGPNIQQNGGFVNQYYGDGIMALFQRSPADALRASIAMQQTLAEYNDYRQEKGRREIRAGIGLHTGSLMMGIIGDTLRLEAGVVSDTVNTASRMEGLTKHFGVSLLLSEASLDKMGSQQDGFSLRYLGRVLVKGRQAPIRIFECFDGDSPQLKRMKAEQKPAFDHALNRYLARDFAAAVEAFQGILAILPDDGPSQHYLKLSQQYLKEGVPATWDGVEVMLLK